MGKFDIELVGKIGSMALVDKEYSDINYNIIARISRELKPGYVWVTSGATEIGRIDFIKRNGYELSRGNESYKSDYSAQGQTILMNTYRQFIPSQYSIRQILVEHSHFNDDVRREYLKQSILRCPEQNAIPIINYNDSVASDEIAKMEVESLRKASHKAVECLDNDETASQIACLVKCKTLLLLTSVDGIYKDVKDSSTLIKEIAGKNIDELLAQVDEHQKLCHGVSRIGAHGAKAKLEYIKEPIKNGSTVIIGNPKYKIKELLEGSVPRTIIHVR